MLDLKNSEFIYNLLDGMKPETDRLLGVFRFSTETNAIKFGSHRPAEEHEVCARPESVHCGILQVHEATLHHELTSCADKNS